MTLSKSLSCSVLTSFGLLQYIDSPTHKLGGTLDIIVASCDEPPKDIAVDDVGFSDQSLLLWMINLAPPPKIYNTTTRQSWQSFKSDDFIKRLRSSVLCSPCRPHSDIDRLTAQYSSVITDILDEMAPMKIITVCERPQWPWYDDDCRSSRKESRRLKMKFHADKKLESWARWRNAPKKTVGNCLMQSRHLTGRSKSMQQWQRSSHLESGRWSSCLDESRSSSKVVFMPRDCHDYIDAKIARMRAWQRLHLHQCLIIVLRQTIPSSILLARMMWYAPSEPHCRSSVNRIHYQRGYWRNAPTSWLHI